MLVGRNPGPLARFSVLPPGVPSAPNSIDEAVSVLEMSYPSRGIAAFSPMGVPRPRLLWVVWRFIGALSSRFPLF